VAARWRGAAAFELGLLALGVVVYAVTRLWAPEAYPIYFFSDEAIHANQAQQLLEQGFRDSSGTLLPPYFQNLDRWNLSLSVYLHLLTVALFGKSVAVVRATSALVSLLGALAVALTLRSAFGSRVWWAGLLVLAGLPTWFLHSRTAFEAVLMASFYAGFLWAYLGYRLGRPWLLLAALLFGAAAFYSYANGPVVMAAAGLLLLVSDLRYHLAQRRRLKLSALALAVVLALPFLRFRALHPEAIAYQMRVVDAHWARHATPAESAQAAALSLAAGLDPRYWFLPNELDLARHRMDGLGLLPLWLLPFAAAGLALCLVRWRSPAHRALLAAALAAVAPALVATLYTTRGLAFVVPATLLGCLGLDLLVEGLARRLPFRPLALGTAALLVAWNLFLLNRALVAGPTWSTDYGLYGMQYGATQVFGTLRELMGQQPDLVVNVSPEWTNNAPEVARFFLPAEALGRVRTDNVRGFTEREGNLDPSLLFVLPADEYERARSSPKLALGEVERTIPYPDGRPGFYFLRMRYRPEARSMFAAELAAMQRPVTETVALDGQEVTFIHSVLDMGRPVDLFDGDPDTLIRGKVANPLQLTFDFPAPRPLSGLRLHTTRQDMTLEVTALPPDGGPARSAAASVRNSPVEPWVTLELPGGAQPVSRLEIEITDLGPGPDYHVHVRELELR
jgi:hypothetical protein